MNRTGLALTLMTLVVLTGCGRKLFNLSLGTGGSGTTAGPAPTPAQGIKGNWSSGCISGVGIELKFVVTDTTFRMSQENYSTVTCDPGTESSLVILDSTYTYDENTQIADTVLTHGYVTHWDAARINDLNTGVRDCGPQTWQVGVQREITDVSPCSEGTATSGATPQYTITFTDPDTLEYSGVTLTRQ